jgi:CubicO group peptidase (beta-lactamase class C family)
MSLRRFRAGAAIGLATWVSAGPVGSDPPAPKATPEALTRAVDAYVAPLVESGLFSGTVLLARGGEVLVERAYGQADIAGKVPNAVTTRHKLMSVTKSITAVAVLRLVAAGKLALEDPVAKHLPGWPKGWASVTVRHLLDHTSGIGNLELEWVVEARAVPGRGLAPWQRLAPKVAARTLEAPAGTKHAYTNFHYVLLGAIAEQVSGRPAADLVREEVLAPAGMADTAFDDGSAQPRLAVGYFRGPGGLPEHRGQDMSEILTAGGLYATARDLYRLDRALRGDKLLPDSLRARMVAPEPHTFGYALGWQVRPVQERPCVRHSGGANGYVADFLRFPEDDACVVVLSNFAFAPILLLGEDLSGLLLGRDVAMPARLTRERLDDYVGSYRGPSSTVVVRRSGDLLTTFELPAGQRRVSALLLVALGEHRFRRQAWPTSLRFDVAGPHATALRMEVPPPMPPVHLERVEAPTAAWSKAEGHYQAKDGGASYRIAGAKGRLELRPPSGWGGDLELLPVTDTAALTLYGEEFGTVLELVPDPKGAITGFRWTRNDGRVVECARAGR